MSSLVGWLSDIGAEEQAPIYCHSGIELFVNLKIDHIESRQVDGLSSQNYNSDAPKFIQTLSSASVNVDEQAQLTSEQKVHDGKGRQLKTSCRDIGSRTDRKPSCTNIDRRALDGNLLWPFEEVTRQESRHVVSNETSGELERPGKVEDRRTVPEVGARKVLAAFVSPSDGHIVGEPQCLTSLAQTLIEKHQGTPKESDYPDGRSNDDYHKELWDAENLGMQLGCGFHSKRNLVRGFHDLLANWKARLEDIEPEDPGLCEVRSIVHEGPYVCIENRSWSPLVEDYSWVERMGISGASDNRVTGWSDDSTWLGEGMDQDRATLPSSPLLSENEVEMQSEQAAPTLEILSPNSAEIESFDGADVLAARTILELSAACRKEVMEQDPYFNEVIERGPAAIMELSAINGEDVHNLGFSCESNKQRKSAKMVEETYATLPDVKVRSATNASKPSSKNVELSLRGGEDRYIPRIVRAKSRPRGSKFSTRIDFVNPECEEESEDEVLQRSPRKRRYKSTQELYC